MTGRAGPPRVAVTRAGALVTVEIGDGTRRNALGDADWRALGKAVREAGTTSGVAAVLVLGHGGQFSAGSDLTEWADADADDVDRSFAVMEDCFRAVEDVPVPVVASVEGLAVGAGCQLALACDLVVMGESASIGMPIVRLGILTSPAFAARVSSRVGSALAADLYLTGRLLSAHEAQHAGLVARVVPDDQAVAKARDLATGIAGRPAPAAQAAKAALQGVGQPGRSVPEASGRSVIYGTFHSAVHRFLSMRRRPA